MYTCTTLHKFHSCLKIKKEIYKSNLILSHEVQSGKCIILLCNPF